MQTSAIGLRIREQRRKLGVKQVDLAERVGVSASYLNLIEANKRRIGGALLNRIGREIGLSADQLDGTAERLLREDLLELAADPEIGGGATGAAEADELIARHPAWARAAARAWRRQREAAAEAEAMADRLTHDPALGAAVHGMLTEITALRSTSEILAEGGDMSADQRRRFEQIVFEQSSRLADSGASLAAYFDRTSEERRRRTPASDAEEAIERLTDISARIEAEATETLRHAPEALDTGVAGAGWLERRENAALALGAAIAERILPELLTDAFADEPGDRTEATEARMAEIIALRCADALLLPAATFLTAGGESGWDLAELARAADGDVARAMRRLAALMEEGAPRAAHVSVDAAGRVLSRGGALALTPRSRMFDCPVWPVHRPPRAGYEQTPLRAPDDSRAFAIAWGRPDGMGGEMLLIAPEDAHRTVYAAIAAGKPANVGPDCRICAHRECAWRREPPVVEA